MSSTLSSSWSSHIHLNVYGWSYILSDSEGWHFMMLAQPSLTICIIPPLVWENSLGVYVQIYILQFSHI